MRGMSAPEPAGSLPCSGTPPGRPAVKCRPRLPWMRRRTRKAAGGPQVAGWAAACLGGGGDHPDWRFRRPPADRLGPGGGRSRRARNPRVPTGQPVLGVPAPPRTLVRGGRYLRPRPPARESNLAEAVETATSWAHPCPPPNPLRDRAPGGLFGVACTSASACMAGRGQHHHGQGVPPGCGRAVERHQGGTIQPTPNPPQRRRP